MLQTRKALFYSALIVFSIPQVAEAQFSLDAATSPGDVSFSNNSILPLQNAYPPLNSAVNLGQDIYKSNSAPPDTGAYNPTGIFQVDDINQAAKDSKPSFLKDLVFGQDPNRPLHSSTVKVFDILGKAQKGLQTYKLGRSVYDAVRGKDPGGIVGGARSLLLLYGIIDPNTAVASAAALGTTDIISTVAGASTSTSKTLNAAAFDKPKNPSDWIIKSQNNDSLRSLAAQKGSDIVLSKDGQKRLEAEDESVLATAEALEVVISDAAQSAVAARQMEVAAQEQAKSSIEVAGKTQKRKSTQQAVKDLSTQASIQNNLSAVQVSTLNELNDNSLRSLGGMASIVGMQRVQTDKTTTIQLMTALNGRQLANINSGVLRSHNYQVRKDLKVSGRKQLSMQRLIIPRVSTPAQPQQGQP